MNNPPPMPSPLLRLVALIVLIAFTGCATDQQRTKTGGAALGAVGGAILGGAAGAALAVLSGNRDNVASFAIAGATAGAVMGGMAGYRWGQRVAYKKEHYKTAEDRLAANIRRAGEVRVAASQENAKLRGEVAQLNQQLQALASNGNRNHGARQQLASFVDQRRQDVTKKIELTRLEIADRTEALQADRNASPQRAAELRAQINNLAAERTQMQQHNRELASIRPRLGV